MSGEDVPVFLADVRIDILVLNNGLHRLNVDWPKKGERDFSTDEYSDDEFRQLSNDAENRIMTMADNVSSHRIVESRQDDVIIRCIVELHLDRTESLLNSIEYFGELTQEQIVQGIFSLNEAAEWSHDLILKNIITEEDQENN